jgi:sodium/hydrogen exchanger-like protein 6/7
MSLLLKHSSLNLYPQIETCLVALIAYTSYFLSNGLSMSGIVSLLFCGITLKHYAYHTMSRRTQRATKYIFATLAQMSENFIFIYLGLSLFTSAPSSEPVFSYFKPLFIIVSAVAVIFTRYAAVFPLSEAINFFLKHARGQRAEELPHSYQMMLFWAGLRGAVGVALAAGFQGPNGQSLRTTVLVVVLLTVVLFGGTTARMLEVLGVRTGVEDEGAVSSDDELAPGLGMNAWYNRRSPGSRWNRFAEDGDPYVTRDPGRVGLHYGITNSYSHHTQASASLNITNVFSTASSDSDTDNEVLPLASTVVAQNISRPQSRTHSRQSSGAVTPVVEEGKWFQELDERYLLPLFSNATASRTFHARRARKSQMNSSLAAGSSNALGTPAESEDEMDATEIELGTSRPWQSGGNGTGNGPSGLNPERRLGRGLSNPMLRRENDNQTNQNNRDS